MGFFLHRPSSVIVQVYRYQLTISSFIVISQFFTVGERYWLKLWGEGEPYVIHLKKTHALAAYTTQVQSVYTLIRPAISDQHQSQYYADAHQHVLHHTGNASEAFATDVASLRL